MPPAAALKRRANGSDARRHVLKNLRNGAQLSLDDDEAALLRLLDGTHSMADLAVASEARLGAPGPVRLAALLGRSRYVTDLLTRDPEALRLLADDRELAPRTPEVLCAGFTAAAVRHADPMAAANAVRALRRRELFRVACGDLLGTEAGTPLPGLADVSEVGSALADITDATLAATLASASKTITFLPHRRPRHGTSRSIARNGRWHDRHSTRRPSKAAPVGRSVRQWGRGK